MLQLPDVRRIEFGWGASVIGELAGQVTLVVYSFDKGGAPLVAAYVASRTLLSMVVTLGIAGLSSGTRTSLLLRRITGLRAALLALAALTAALSWDPAAVIALAAASSSLAGTYRPLQVAVLPWLVRTPAELTSANAVAAVLENSGALARPLLAGGLLVFAAPPLPMVLAAGFVGLAALSLRGLVVPERPRSAAQSSAAQSVAQVARAAGHGLAELARVAPPGGVAILGFAQTFVRGALVVLIAVLAVKTLALGQSAVGWLTAAIGAGGLVGGAAATALVHITRLGRTFVAGLLLWGLPLVWLAFTPSAAVAYLALVVVGVGNAIEDVAGFTLIARCAGPHSAGRVLGATEFVFQAGLGIGAVAAPLLLHTLGVRGTLGLLGGGLTVLTGAHVRRFARFDMTMPAPGEEVGLLRRLAMFAALPLAVIELLATDLKPHDFAPGTAAVREGEAGDLFYLIVAGSATVNVGGKPGPSLGAGDCFGEIALLRNIPRVATVVADQPMRTLALEREAFLVAIASNGMSGAAADALVDQRLLENTRANADGGSAE
ncbi:MAG TPA: cyclic nucleotide-binding domain-containing protein [Streptosporangiaceae bacterium]|nr:cyclic nucleotide-binding domain-containing protein [Streptosporangiaceae bacterium]